MVAMLWLLALLVLAHHPRGEGEGVWWWSSLYLNVFSHAREEQTYWKCSANQTAPAYFRSPKPFWQRQPRLLGRGLAFVGGERSRIGLCLVRVP